MNIATSQWSVGRAGVVLRIDKTEHVSWNGSVRCMFNQGSLASSFGLT